MGVQPAGEVGRAEAELGAVAQHWQRREEGDEGRWECLERPCLHVALAESSGMVTESMAEAPCEVCVRVWKEGLG